MPTWVPPPSGPTEEEPDPWEPSVFARLARGHGPFRRLLRALVRTPTLLAGLGLLLFFGVLALASLALDGGSSSLVVHFDWAANPFPPGPSRAHPFGVMDGLGVDVAQALFLAVPWDLAILGSILGLAAVGGVLAGACAGFFRGPFDWVVTSLVDLLLAVPPFFLVVVLYLGVVLYFPIDEHLPLFVALFGFVLWPYYARPVRARAQSIAAEPYVEAARASGSPPSRILLRHVIPNSLGPAFAQLPIDVYQVFFVLTVFPFLACYNATSLLSPLPSPQFPEWGNLLALGVCFGWSPLAAVNFWWMYAFPALTVIAFGIGVALLSDGASSILEAKLRV
ncbi:MAG: ABC transporter permease subunit [Thermoplasmata archaeon]|nr:ABC transporter permease subunit [Thermoplasmata archaeon]